MIIASLRLVDYKRERGRERMKMTKMASNKKRREESDMISLFFLVVIFYFFFSKGQFDKIY